MRPLSLQVALLLAAIPIAVFGGEAGSYDNAEAWLEPASVGAAPAATVPTSQQAQHAGQQPGAAGFVLGDSRWEVHLDQKYQQRYFYNTATNTSQWEDPRKDVPVPLRDQLLLWLTPLSALAAALIARLLYLQHYYPDLLWPSRERKVRAQRRGRLKMRKARGKMSQDGKGGRSANS